MAELTTAGLAEFLDAPRFAAAATISKDGSPQLTPIWYIYEGGNFYFGIATNSVKYRNLVRDPRMGLHITAEHPDTTTAIAYGSAELVKKSAPGIEDIGWRITRRYHDSDEEARAYRLLSESEGVESVMVKITPKKWVTWDSA